MLAGSTTVVHRERVQAELRTAETLQVAVERALDEWEEEGETGVNSLLTTTRKNSGEVAAGGLVLLIFDAKGRLLWRSARDVPPWPQSDPRWRTATLTRHGQTLVLARSWLPIEQRIHNTAVSFAILSVLAILTTSIGSWFAVGRTLSPIDGLAVQAEAASAVNLHVHLEAPSPDAEIVRLTSTINGLLDRVGQEAKVQSRFYAAAAHELRTPLQALQGHLDVALSRPRAAAEYKKALIEAQEQTGRLTRLIQDLLQLNALESGTSNPAREEVNAADIIERGLRHYKDEIRSRDLQVHTELPDLDVCVPVMHLEIVTRNLIENSVKYAPTSSEIFIDLHPAAPNAHGPDWSFSTRNQCALAPGADLSLWLEPFFRPDTSRHSATGGNGLGLAIVKAVCDANGWSITLQYQDGYLTAIVSALAGDGHEAA
jgi:signal transduction histidine kinase